MKKELGLTYSQIIAMLQRDIHSLDNAYDINWRFGLAPIPIEHHCLEVNEFSSSKNCPPPDMIEFDYGIVVDDFHKYLIEFRDPIIQYGTSIYIPTRRVLENLKYIYKEASTRGYCKYYYEIYQEMCGWADGRRTKADVVRDDIVETEAAKYVFKNIWANEVETDEEKNTLLAKCITDYWEQTLK